MSRKNNNAPLIRRKDRFRLILMGLAAGLISGLAAILYRLALDGAEHIRELLLGMVRSPISLILMFAGLLTLGIFTGWLTKQEPLIKGSGIPQVEGELLGYYTSKWKKVFCLKFLGGFLTNLCGLSLGREGPSVLLGAMAAKGFCETTNRTNIEKRYLISCGACAGLAAAFNAPLAGVVFGLEEIHKNFSSRALFSAMIACISASYLSILVFGNSAALHLRLESLMPHKYYPVLLLAGVFFGLVCCGHNLAIVLVKKLLQKLPISAGLRIGLVFLLAGVVALTVPEALGSGEGIIAELSTSSFSLKFLLLLFAVKFLFTVICAGSSAPGGTLVTMLVLGALSGNLFGRFAVMFMGFSPSYVFSLTLMGMAAMFSGCVRAPLTGIMLAIELSGSTTHFLGIAMVSLISVLVADLLKVKPLYEQTLEDMVPESRSKKIRRELSTLELTVSYRSPLAGAYLYSLDLPDSCLIAAIDRQGKQLVPKGNTQIMAGDLLTVVCPAGEEGIARHAFGYGGHPDDENPLKKQS